MPTVKLCTLGLLKKADRFTTHTTRASLGQPANAPKASVLLSVHWRPDHPHPRHLRLWYAVHS